MPCRCGSAVSEIEAETLGKATDWPIADRLSRTMVMGPLVENGCRPAQTAVMAMPTASMVAWPKRSESGPVRKIWVIAEAKLDSVLFVPFARSERELVDRFSGK